MERGIVTYPSSSSAFQFLECQESAAECCHTLSVHHWCLFSSRCFLFAGNTTFHLNLLKSTARKTYPKGYFTSVSVALKDTYIWNKNENFFHFRERLLRSSEFTTSSLKTIIFVFHLRSVHCVVNSTELI